MGFIIRINQDLAVLYDLGIEKLFAGQVAFVK
jgi:hypothetical protein